MKKILFLVSLCLLTLTGCAEFEESPIVDSEKPSIFKTRTNAQYQINTDNPYSLQNVQEALESIEGQDAPDLTATHNYVRFLPQDSTDMYILVDSLNLDIFPYPLDYDLTLAEMEAHENTLINGYGWQYCLVPPSFQMPSEMESELLDYAYLLSEETYATRASEYQLDYDLYEEVIDAAFELTGNAPLLTRAGDNPWEPSATIRYQSDVSGEAVMPLENVRVRVNTFFNSGEGYTDEDGNVTISRGWGGKFKNAVQYKIIWSTDFWKIHDDSGKAKYEGPKQREAWDDFVINGSVGSKVAMCATIHRALNAYYNESHTKTNGLVKVDDINVRARWNEHFENGALGRFYRSRNNQIHIVSHYYDNGNRTSLTNIQMLSSTLHELGHASHWQAIDDLGMNEDLYFVGSFIKDTWARGVQYAYMSSLYPNDYIDTFDYFDYTGSTDDYTAVIESLMWQGVTLQQLQTIFMGKTQLEQCRQPTKNLGIVPNWLVDIIFDEPLVPRRANLSNNVIQGPDEPALNSAVTYTVPVWPLPTGMTFVGFTVSGSTTNRTINEPVPYGTLNVTFNSEMVYTITATYNLPDDTTYSVTKTIDTTPLPPPPPPPTTVPILSSQSLPNGQVRVYVTNVQDDTEYRWEIGSNFTLHTDFSDSIEQILTPPAPPVAGLPATAPPASISIRCQARHNGNESAWSQSVLILPDTPGFNFLNQPLYEI
jgi:hypothetical protein